MGHHTSVVVFRIAVFHKNPYFGFPLFKKNVHVVNIDHNIPRSQNGRGKLFITVDSLNTVLYVEFIMIYNVEYKCLWSHLRSFPVKTIGSSEFRDIFPTNF